MRSSARVLGLAALALMFILPWRLVAHPQERRAGQLPPRFTLNEAGSISVPLVPEGERSSQVTHHLTGFYDDRSLDVAIAVEQISTRYIRYTVQLRLPSGVRQSLAVNAPPGGLEAEVRDMTGDDVRNDLVLTPALFPWLSTILVNDGRDHFEVAHSGGCSGSLSPGGDVGRGQRDCRSAAALARSGLHPGGLAKVEGLFLLQQRETRFTPLTQTSRSRFEHSPSLGRDPPVPTTSL